MNYLTFAKDFAAKNGMSFQTAIKSAKTKEAFNKKKGVKAGKKGAASKSVGAKQTMPGKMDFTTKKGGVRKTARKAYV